jgi:hypothetical protein
MQDLTDLRQRLKNSGFLWSALTSTERWRYHAYDYAFLRVRCGIFNLFYPLDPDGKWFNSGMVEAAESIYPPRPGPPSAPIRPADTVRDHELAEHFRRQDAERDELKRQVQVHGERQTDGEPTPEMLVFMRCCMEQGKANAEMYDRRRRAAFLQRGSNNRDAIRRYHDENGITATPSYEDPVALHRGRVELGLEEDVFAETKNTAPGGSR